jgi:energy-converting hydrogenase Eha subunit E
MAATFDKTIQAAQGQPLPERNWRVWLRANGFIVVAYLLATVCTGAFFMGDTADYVESVLKDVEFWEFGHLFWRPLGWLLYQILEPVARFAAGQDPRAGVSLIFVAINWLAGLLAVVSLRSLVARVSKRQWVTNVVCLAFIFSQAFLNFTQTGSSYIPGLALLLLGMSILTRDRESDGRTWPTALFAGLALAGSVLMWFLYVWAIPAALATPLFLAGADRRQRRLVIETALAFGLAVAVAYGVVIAHLGIHNPADLRAWVAASSHGIAVGGASRVVFGLPRSFINMGNDGLLFKRFLLDDPYNPVRAFDLLRLSLWKLALFYTFAALVLINLLRSAEGKRIIGLLALNSLPVLAFAALFDGGAVERYLPLYPAIFLSLASALGVGRTLVSLKAAVLAFIAVAAITNISVMASPVLDREQEKVTARVKELEPLMKPEDRVFTLNQQDELVNFNRSFPFNPMNQGAGLGVRPVLLLGTPQVAEWRKDFASQALASWQLGGDVWVSNRLLAPRPLAEWYWVEGDDRRVVWEDLYGFFSQMEVGQMTGGPDGFVLLTRSPKNERLLKNELLLKKTSAS